MVYKYIGSYYNGDGITPALRAPLIPNLAITGCLPGRVREVLVHKSPIPASGHPNHIDHNLQVIEQCNLHNIRQPAKLLDIVREGEFVFAGFECSLFLTVLFQVFQSHGPCLFLGFGLGWHLVHLGGGCQELLCGARGQGFHSAETGAHLLSISRPGIRRPGLQSPQYRRYLQPERQHEDTCVDLQRYCAHNKTG